MSTRMRASAGIIALTALVAALAVSCGRGQLIGLTPEDAGAFADPGADDPGAPRDGTDAAPSVERDGGKVEEESKDGGERPRKDAGFEDGGTKDDAGEATDAGDTMDAGPKDAGTPDTGMACPSCPRGDHCDPASAACVECLDDSHCFGGVCDVQGGHRCRVRCFNSQCGPLGVCDPSIDACVECLGDSDCDQGVCNTSIKECVECASDADCALVPERHTCDTATGECVGCASDAACPGGEQCQSYEGRFCAPPAGRDLCTPCRNDSECGGPADLCIGVGGFDRACAVDCSQSACPTGYECVQVRQGTALQCRPRYDMQMPTCRGTRSLGEACAFDPNDLDPGCGWSGVQDARCELLNNAGICVTWCDDNNECPSGFVCVRTGGGGQGRCI